MVNPGQQLPQAPHPATGPKTESFQASVSRLVSVDADSLTGYFAKLAIVAMGTEKISHIHSFDELIKNIASEYGVTINDTYKDALSSQDLDLYLIDGGHNPFLDLKAKLKEKIAGDSKLSTTMASVLFSGQ